MLKCGIHVAAVTNIRMKNPGKLNSTVRSIANQVPQINVPASYNLWNVQQQVATSTTDLQATANRQP